MEEDQYDVDNVERSYGGDMKNLRIAVIPGDGIGKEVMPEGLRCLEAVAKKHGIRFQWDEFDWSCDYYLKHGEMMPPDW